MAVGNYYKTKDILEDLGLAIVKEDESRDILVASDEANGIINMIFDCAEPVLIMEQVVLPTPQADREAFFERILQINRKISFGGFAIDSQSKAVLFRATHQFARITKDMIEASLRGLEQAITQFGPELAAMLQGK